MNLIEELLKVNTTEAIAKIKALNPEMFEREVRVYNQQHSQPGQSFEARMIKKEVQENLYIDLFRISDEEKLKHEAAAYFEVEPFWIRYEHILNLYSFLVTSLQKGGRFKEEWFNQYPAFIEAIRYFYPELLQNRK